MNKFQTYQWSSPNGDKEGTSYLLGYDWVCAPEGQEIEIQLIKSKRVNDEKSKSINRITYMPIATSEHR